MAHRIFAALAALLGDAVAVEADWGAAHLFRTEREAALPGAAPS